MKRRRILVILSLIIFGLLSLYLCIGGFPIIINNHENQVLYLDKEDNEKFNPLKNINFESGRNKVLLLFTLDDINELPQEITKRKVLICSDNEVLEQLKNNFTFEFSGGDMSTVTSEIVVFREGKLVLKTNFVLDNNTIGIQDEKTGWAKAVNSKDLYNIFSKFKPYRNFFLIL